MVTLEFKDNGETANCKILGSTEWNGERYAVFLDEATKELYIYKYLMKGKKKARLFPIIDQQEFRGVCGHLTTLLGNKEGGIL